MHKKWAFTLYLNLFLKVCHIMIKILLKLLNPIDLDSFWIYFLRYEYAFLFKIWLKQGGIIS